MDALCEHCKGHGRERYATRKFSWLHDPKHPLNVGAPHPDWHHSEMGLEPCPRCSGTGLGPDLPGPAAGV